MSRFTASFTCQSILVIIATLSIRRSFTYSLVSYFIELPVAPGQGSRIIGLSQTFRAHRFIFSLFSFKFFCSFRVVDKQWRR